MNPIKEIKPEDFQKMIDAGEDIQLIDVREVFDYECFNIDGECMPLDDIEQYVDQISSDKPVIFHCDFGLKSVQAIEKLQKEFGFTNLYNLQGGIRNYIKFFNAKT